MDLRMCAAPKRRSPEEAIEDIGESGDGSGISDGSVGTAWGPSPTLTATDSVEQALPSGDGSSNTTRSVSDGSTDSLVVSPPPQQIEFSSWDILEGSSASARTPQLQNATPRFTRQGQKRRRSLTSETITLRLSSVLIMGSTHLKRAVSGLVWSLGGKAARPRNRRVQSVSVGFNRFQPGLIGICRAQSGSSTLDSPFVLRSRMPLDALEEFKSNNPAWSKRKCVLVDKAFTEMSVLKTAFPGVTVLLCQFHVLKYLREEIAGSVYCFNAWEKYQLRGVMSLLAYANMEAEYAKNFTYMVYLARSGRNGHDSGQVGVTTLSNNGSLASEEPNSEQTPFVAYFETNWDNCRERWCAYKRQNAVRLGNNTNNRLEFSWKQLKE
ncbi:unnamed protein product [Phytophthora fragariaefolia]|uniref:Unnamed protein product n=1 Tax=Phytophthora fragariaefolia TaxID=1490495 RepID=A0A9W6XBR8_9STRA|nr:unnamed protein product [Phytophthora fragariaefolia]